MNLRPSQMHLCPAFACTKVLVPVQVLLLVPVLSSCTALRSPGGTVILRAICKLRVAR